MPPKQKKFSREDNETLKRLYDELSGTMKKADMWHEIGRRMGREPRNVRDRHKNFIKSSKEFTNEEKMFMLSLILRFGDKNIKLINSYFPNKTYQNVYTQVRHITETKKGRETIWYPYLRQCALFSSQNFAPVPMYFNPEPNQEQFDIAEQGVAPAVPADFNADFISQQLDISEQSVAPAPNQAQSPEPFDEQDLTDEPIF